MVRTGKIIFLLLATTLVVSGCAYHAGVARLPSAPLYNEALTFHNVRYLPLLRFCEYYNLDYDWDLVSQKIEIKKGGKTLVLRPDSNLVLVNNTPMELASPIEYRNGAAYIPIESAVFLSEYVFEVERRLIPEKKRYEIKTVVIDPGHGGKDPGAISRYGTREKDIVLDISKRLKRQLEGNGVNVILTRDRDIFIPLYKRAAFANGKNADLFISVHANASRYSRAMGFEVYYLSEATDDNARALAAAENASLKFEEVAMEQNKGALSENPTACDLVLSEARTSSKDLAYYICNTTSDSLGMRKRGVKGARFAVLKGAVMPAVLVEVGFLTNRREEDKLKRSSFREKVAGAISRSILAYKREYERTNGFSD